MGWVNYYGIAVVAIIIIPNIIWAVKSKGTEVNIYKNKIAEIFEQIARYACIALMIFNIPHTYLNFWFNNALTIYLAVNGVLCFAYLVGWVVFWNKNNKAKALLLSILPSVIFIFSGTTLASIPLLVFAVIFAVNHVLISYKNAK